MRAWLLVSVGFVSLPAAAGPYEKYDSIPSSVTLSGPIEVPLYTTAWGTNIPCVEVQIGEKTFLFELGTFANETWVSEDVAKAVKAKLKTSNQKFVNTKGKDNKDKVGGKVTRTTLDEIHIGEMVLQGVPVITSDQKGYYDTHEEDIPEGLHVDGVLSLPATGVAWAVVPSKGVVRFAPASGGEALVTELGGTAYDYTSSESYKYKFGKKGKLADAGRPMWVDLKVGGQDSPDTILAIDGGGMGFVHPRIAGDATSRWHGDLRVVLTSVEVAGVTVPSEGAVIPGITLYEDYVPRMPSAIVGADVLSLFDVAADPVNHKVAFKAAPTQTRADPTPHLIAEAEKGLVKPEPKPDDPPPKADEPEWKPNPKVLSKLAALHDLRGELDQSLVYWTQIKDQDVRSCDAWENMGNKQMGLLDFDGAVASFTQASQLYHAWWDLPIAQRNEEAKQLGKLDEDEKKAAEHYVQAAECYTADAWLAAALEAKGDTAGVAELVKTKTDLDHRMMDVQGTSSLAAGNPTAAQAAYRQSTQIAHRMTDTPRLGLAIAYAEAGDWKTARPMLERYLSDEPGDVEAVLYWLDNVRAKEGPDAALKAVTAFAAEHPMSGNVALVYWREAKRAGSATDLARADDQVARTYGRSLQTAETNWGYAQYGRHLVDTGKLDDAAQYIAKAEQVHPDSNGTWFAKAELAAAKGNAADVSAALERARLVDPIDPISALVKAGKFGPTVAPAAPAPAPAPAPVHEPAPSATPTKWNDQPVHHP